MNLEEEKLLIDKIKADKTQFKEIFTQYGADVYRYCYSFVNDKQKAEDLSSEVFLKGYEKFDSFEWMGVSIKYWLIGIARNTIYKQHAKKSQLTENLQISEFEEEFFSGDEIDHDLAEDMMKYMSQLPELTREIIVLKVWEEYKFDEISTLMDMSESSVKMQFYRGLEKLKQLMSNDGYEESKLKLPMLFGSIMFTKEAYQPDLSFMNTFSELLANNSGVVGTVNLLNIANMSSKVKLLIVSLVSVVIVGGGVGSYLWYESTNDDNSKVQQEVKKDDVKKDEEEDVAEKDDEETVVEQPVVVPPVSQNGPVTEPTVEEVPVDPYAGWEYYYSDNFGLGFYHPPDITLNENEQQIAFSIGFVDSYRTVSMNFYSDFFLDSYTVYDGHNPSEMSPIVIAGQTYVFDKYLTAHGGPGGFSSQTFYNVSFSSQLIEGVYIESAAGTCPSCAVTEYQASPEDIETARLIIESIEFTN